MRGEEHQTRAGRSRRLDARSGQGQRAVDARLRRCSDERALCGRVQPGAVSGAHHLRGRGIARSEDADRDRGRRVARFALAGLSYPSPLWGPRRAKLALEDGAERRGGGLQCTKNGLHNAAQTLIDVRIPESKNTKAMRSKERVAPTI